MIRPLNEYIAVRPDPTPESIGLLSLPPAHRDRAHHNGDGVLSSGTVVAVGRGDLIREGPRKGEHVPVDVQVGDRILFPRHELVPTLEDGTQVLHQQHVYGVLEGASA